MKCTKEHPVNKQKVKLLDSLEEVLGSKEAADVAFQRVAGPDFIERFGDWTKEAKFNEKGEPLEAGHKEEIMYLSDAMEPQLYERRGQYFFKDKNGDAIWVHRDRYPNMRPEESSEVTEQITAWFVEEQRQQDFEDNDAINFGDLDNSMARFIAEQRGLTQDEEIIGRIDTVEGYLPLFKEDVMDKIKGQGFKYMIRKQKEVKNSETDPTDNIEEEEKTSGLNIGNSFDVSSKDRARANTKLLLSQIRNIQYRAGEDGKDVEVKGNYLTTASSYVPIDEVWSTLEPHLTDIVGFSKGSDITYDVYTQMINKLKSLGYVKPWIRNVVSLLDNLGSNKMYKKIEFVQAFSTVRLNFNVVEYNKEGNTYQKINATNANTRKIKIRNGWDVAFKRNFVSTDGFLKKNAREELTTIMNRINADIKNFKSAKDYNLKADPNNQPYNRAFMTIAHSFSNNLKALGVDVSPFDILSYTRIYAETDLEQDMFPPLQKLFERSSEMLRGILAKDKGDLRTTKTSYVNGKPVVTGTYMPILKDNSVFTDLADGKGLSQVNMAENTIHMNGKTAWTYSVPSYIHNTLNRIKQNPNKVKELHSIPFNTNSLWLERLNAAEGSETSGQPEKLFAERVARNRELLKHINIQLSGSFSEKGTARTSDSKSIQKTDALNENLFKLLALPNDEAIFPTIIAADKSTKYEISGFKAMSTGITRTNGKWFIPKKVINLELGYFEDEYLRMAAAHQKHAQPGFDPVRDGVMYYDYHPKKGVGNAFMSQLHPGLSFSQASEEVRNVLYDENGVPLGTTDKGFTQKQKDVLIPILKEKVIASLEMTEKSFIDNALIEDKGEGVFGNTALPSNVYSKYASKASGENKTTNAINMIIGDYTINGLIGNVEYGKIFSGDPAYYNDINDMFKRIPGTYTDGLQLELKSKTEEILNIAVVEDIKGAANYYSNIAKSLKDPSIGEAYRDGVNTADAQAWISIDRWRFIMERLGRWTDKHNAIWNKIKNGEPLSAKEIKRIMLQPLKGVYFGIDSTGKPTYLKYSQAVLLPEFTKGTELEALRLKMTKDENGDPLDHLDAIHEVITVSGVKVGAQQISKIHKDGNLGVVAKSKMVLNKIQLNNRNWKLQQDLSAKGIKEDADVGSQIQKNILSGLVAQFSKEVYKLRGHEDPVKGRVILKEIIDAVEALTTHGRNKLTKKFDIKTIVKTKVDEKGDEYEYNSYSIGNKEALYDAIIDDFKSRNSDENVVNALNKLVNLESIPQIGIKAQQMLLSMMNKEVIKIQTPGASFIQVSPFGIEHMIAASENGQSSIKIVSSRYDRSAGLKPPRIVNGKVLPGQAFVPMSYLSKILPKGMITDKMTVEQIMEVVPKEAFRMIGYRIPNQGMASNDALEIVGILPSHMGDQILAYNAIPAKTGSDFDIDKMYAMFPAIEWNEDTKKIEVVDSTSDTIKGAQNKLFNAYESVLTSPATYDALMSSIDFKFLKEDIDNLFEEEKLSGHDAFNPTYQVDKKFEYMSGQHGVAQMANQLVDHIQSQIVRLEGTYLGIGNFETREVKGEEVEVQVYDEQFIREGDPLKKSHKIENILSALLNAYVDIAKDPYISRGNHNDITANVVVFLARSGVDIKFINRFVGQPILKELVRATKITRAISSKPLKYNNKIYYDPIEYVKAKHGLKDVGEAGPSMTKELYNSKTKLYEGTQMPLEHMTENEKVFQAKILEAWQSFTLLSGNLIKQTTASKFDTKGLTGTVAGMKALKSRISDAANNIDGFEMKITKGVLPLAEYAHSFIWAESVISNSDLFTSASPGGDALIRGALEGIKERHLINNEDARTAIERELLAYNYSAMPVFKNITPEERIDLLTQLPYRLSGMQNEEFFKKNFFLSNLEITDFAGSTVIKVDNRNKPKTFSDAVTRSWSALMNSKDEAEAKLANDLAKYSWLTSGFRMNYSQFYTYMPHWWLLDNGIEGAVNAARLRNRKLDVNGENTDDIFIDQLHRNNVENELINPLVKSPWITEATEGGFLLDKEKAKAIAQRVEREDGFNYFQYPKYLTYNAGGGVGLFKANDTIHIRDGKKHVLYTRTYTLGKKNQPEYLPLEELTTSAHPENNMTQPLVDAKTKLMATDAVRTHLGLPLIPKKAPKKDNTADLYGFNPEDGFITDDMDSEQRIFSDQKDSIDLFDRKRAYFQSKIDVEIIMDSNVGTSRVLASSDPRSKAAGKPVIVLNPTKVFSDTIPHEFAHVFLDLIPRGSANPKFRKAVEQLKDSAIWAEVEEKYPHLSGELLEKEVMATAMGLEGAIQFNNMEDKNTFMGFLKWLFNFIKRKLGLEKNAVKVLVLDMMNTSTKTETHWSEIDQQQITSEKTEEQKEMSREIKDINELYAKLINNITRIKHAMKPQSAREKGTKAAGEKRIVYKSVQVLEKQVKLLEETNKRKGFMKYLQWADNLLDIHRKAYNNVAQGPVNIENQHEDWRRDIISGATNALESLNGIQAISQFISDELNERNGISVKEAESYRRRINKIKNKFDDLQRDVLGASKQEYARFMVDNTTRYITDAKTAYGVQYEQTSPSGYLDKEDYINQMWQKNYKVHREEAFQDFIKQASTAPLGMGSLESKWIDQKNQNSAEVHALSKLVDASNLTVREFSATQVDLFKQASDEFLSGATGRTMRDKYINLIDDTTGDKKGIYLISRYKAEFVNEYMSYRDDVANHTVNILEAKGSGTSFTYKDVNGKTIKGSLNDIRGEIRGDFVVHDQGLLPNGLLGKVKIPLTEAIAISQLRWWESANVIKPGGIPMPASHWQNPKYNKLSDNDKKMLDFLTEKSVEADKLYDERTSRIWKIGGTGFIRLPGVTKSSLDRFLTEGPLNYAGDAITDTFKVKEDETHQFAGEVTMKDSDFVKMKADTNSRELHSVPVPFRAKLSDKDQSYDLATIMFMDIQAAKNNQVKNELTSIFNIMLNVMKERDVTKRTGPKGKLVLNAFSKGFMDTLYESKDELAGDVKSVINIMERRLYGITSTGSKTAHKISGTLMKWAGKNALMLNYVADVVNAGTGTVNNFIDAMAGDVFTKKNWMNAQKKYYNDMKEILSDIGHNVSTSRTNALMKMFNAMGQHSMLDYKFEDTTVARALFDQSTARSIAHSGEHMIHGKLMYSILDSVKVKNADGRYIDKNGKPTTKEKAASLDEMIEFKRDKNGELVRVLHPSVFGSSLTDTTGMKGPVGDEQDIRRHRVLADVSSLIKKKVFDLQGAYDNEVASAASREWWGKVAMFLRKWLISNALRRWRGGSTMHIEGKKLKSHQKFYSEDSQSYEEGYYVTAIRFLRETIPAALREANIMAFSNGVKALTPMQKANMKRLLTELGTLGAFWLAYSLLGDDAEDDYLGLRARYLIKREIGELSFFWNPVEAYKIFSTPSAMMGTTEKVIRLFKQGFTDPTEDYQQGAHKGRNKFMKMSGDVIPFLSFAQKDIENSLKFLQK